MNWYRSSLLNPGVLRPRECVLGGAMLPLTSSSDHWTLYFGQRTLFLIRLPPLILIFDWIFAPLDLVLTFTEAYPMSLSFDTGLSLISDSRKASKFWLGLRQRFWTDSVPCVVALACMLCSLIDLLNSSELIVLLMGYANSKLSRVDLSKLPDLAWPMVMASSLRSRSEVCGSLASIARWVLKESIVISL